MYHHPQNWSTFAVFSLKPSVCLGLIFVFTYFNNDDPREHRRFRFWNQHQTGLQTTHLTHPWTLRNCHVLCPWIPLCRLKRPSLRRVRSRELISSFSLDMFGSAFAKKSARTLNNNGNHSTWSYRITVMLGPSPHKISRSPFPRWIKRSELEAKRLEADFGLGKRWQIVGPGDSSWNLEQTFLDVYNVYNYNGKWYVSDDVWTLGSNHIFKRWGSSWIFR